MIGDEAYSAAADSVVSGRSPSSSERCGADPEAGGNGKFIAWENTESGGKPDTT